ncbi:unnamed protein product [Leptosia nina]|uniref:RWD domain-containing protein n=1 Tax=Leptosia nina TaxID=320188 RepID=A0AAV1K375_9NEOP
MTNVEQQAEEMEVLKSIYEGDKNFHQLNDTTYQYKYTEGEESFIVEVSWGPNYPTEKPRINLDIFFNQHLLPSVKQKILEIIDKEAEHWIGSAMTYTLFEIVKERVVDIFSAQTEQAGPSGAKISMGFQMEKKKLVKKKQLRKARKRRESGSSGEWILDRKSKKAPASHCVSDLWT